MAKKTTTGATSQAVSRKPLNATMRGLMIAGAGLLAFGGFAGAAGLNDPDQSSAIAEERGDAASTEAREATSTTTVTSTTTAIPEPGEIGRSQSEPSDPDAAGVATVTEEVTVTRQAETPEPVDQGNEPHSEQTDDSTSLSERDSAPPVPASPRPERSGPPLAWGPKMGTQAPPGFESEHSYGRHAQLVPGQSHVIAPGETLAQISHRSGVSMWTIAKANGIDNPDRIAAGTVIVIPDA